MAASLHRFDFFLGSLVCRSVKAGEFIVRTLMHQIASNLPVLACSLEECSDPPEVSRVAKGRARLISFCPKCNHEIVLVCGEGRTSIELVHICVDNWILSHGEGLNLD